MEETKAADPPVPAGRKGSRSDPAQIRQTSLRLMEAGREMEENAPTGHEA